MAKYEVVDADFVKKHLFTMKHIDVRPHFMYAAGFIPGAINCEWENVREAGGDVVGNFKKKVEFLGFKPDENLIVYCREGVLTKQASEALAEAGYTKIHAYMGSFTDWISEPSRPVQRPLV